MSTNAYPRLSTVDDTSSIDRSIDPQEVTFLGNGGGANTASGGGSSSGLLSKFFKKTTITTTTTSSMATTGGANKAGEIASMFVDGSHVWKPLPRGDFQLTGPQTGTRSAWTRVCEGGNAGEDVPQGSQAALLCSV